MKNHDLWGTCCSNCGNVIGRAGCCPAGCSGPGADSSLEPNRDGVQKDILATPAHNAVRQRPTFRQSSQLYGRMPWVFYRWIGRYCREVL